MILFTGATGLVGQHAVAALLTAGYKIKALYRTESSIPVELRDSPQVEWIQADILDLLSLKAAIQGCSTVIHAAGLVSYDPKDKEILHKVNVEGTANVVNLCLEENSVQQLLHISSIAAIGRQKGKQVADEQQPWEPSAHHTHYATSKQAAEMEVWRGYAEGLPVTILNPAVVLAANEYERSSGQLIQYVIEEKPFFIHGTMNWVDVRDLAQLMVQALSLPEAIGQRFIVSAGSMSYKHFFQKLADYLHKKAPFIGIGKAGLKLGAAFFTLKGLISKGPSLVTSETVKLGGSQVRFDHSKVANTFNFTFRPFEETLDWISHALKNPNSSIH